MTWLIIDNYDSYTYNLFHLIAETTGTDPIVMKNDSPELARHSLEGIDALVISPGPGSPDEVRDTGHVPLIMERAAQIPILGVCMGHQAIAYAAGGRVVHAPRPRHGHLTSVRHDGTGLFLGIPPDFTAVRYHSLCVVSPMPEAIEPTAWAEDGVVMALQHRVKPHWGVQFHPESIGSEHGPQLIRNFSRLVSRHWAQRELEAAMPVVATDPVGQAPVTSPSSDHHHRLVHLAIPHAVDTETVFGQLFVDSDTAFWLDSSRVEEGLSRFSFLGDAAGPLSEILSYRVTEDAVHVRDAAGSHTEAGGIFALLERRLARRKLTDPRLPFDFIGGYVGYFGYEMAGDTITPSQHVSPTPDALWIFADRLIVVDHEQDVTYVLALHDDDKESVAGARAWVDEMHEQVTTLCGGTSRSSPAHADVVDPTPYLVRSADDYVDDIGECQRNLVDGESYEICLTNRIRVPFSGNNFELYRRLRACNPAPYSAFLKFGDLAVFCSSPERFLRIDRDGRAESKPIKGTARRDPNPIRDRNIAEQLMHDPKARAENLMIVDLLRNDLGKVARIGGVSVPSLMAVESYSTVHQLVSTIRADLRDDVSAVQCVRQCFPGGSMTGAPKVRTMEIIDALETEARGIYAGTLGYFGLGGTADLNIVIRAAVRVDDELTIGAGGAIVLDSTPADELAEMLLKAQAPLRALPIETLPMDEETIDAAS